MRRGGNKYGAKRTVVDDITFDSKAEAKRYEALKLLERAGVISQLELQPVYELAPAVKLGDRKKPALRYKADFAFLDNVTGQRVVEDVKGVETPLFRVKRHLMATVHGIHVRVVR